MLVSVYKSINVHQSGIEEKKVRYNLKSNGISLRGFEGKIFFDKIFLQSIKKKKIGFYYFFFFFVFCHYNHITNKTKRLFLSLGWQNITLCAGIHFIIIFFYSSMEYINEMSYMFNLLFSRLFFFFTFCFLFYNTVRFGS